MLKALISAIVLTANDDGLEVAYPHAVALLARQVRAIDRPKR